MAGTSELGATLNETTLDQSQERISSIKDTMAYITLRAILLRWRFQNVASMISWNRF